MLGRQATRILLNKRVLGWSEPRYASTATITGALDPQPEPEGVAAAAAANPLLARYAHLLQSGGLMPDERQQSVVVRLAALLDELQVYAGKMKDYKVELEQFKVQPCEAFYVAGGRPLHLVQLHYTLSPCHTSFGIAHTLHTHVYKGNVSPPGATPTAPC